MAHHQKSRPDEHGHWALPDDLYDICGQQFDEGAARQRRNDLMDRDRRLADEVPITEAEIEVFEAWFGDLFDELFSTRH